MKKVSTTFDSGHKEYYVEAWVDDDRRWYDVTECYTFNDDETESIDVDWRLFMYEIEYALE